MRRNSVRSYKKGTAKTAAEGKEARHLAELSLYSDNQAKIARLRAAYQNNSLALYLGAGVSLGSGLPSWEELVLLMYFSALELQARGERIKPYPNYLFAIAEWHLKGRKEPPDITARKIRRHYKGSTFLTALKNTLYAGFQDPWDGHIQTPDINRILESNSTLGAVVNLCASSTDHSNPNIRTIISYNYDNLLELGLDGKVAFQSIWKATQKPSDQALSIYHVHGYIPIDHVGSKVADIVFTEDQYHRVAQDAYSWSNLVQIRTLSNSVGLMVGLSLSDRNMRRLLDAIRNAPINTESYILLQIPTWPTPTKKDIENIDRNARRYYEMYKDSGIKTRERKFPQIREIIEAIEANSLKDQTLVFEEFGISPIWYKDHSDIPVIIEQIAK